MSGLSRRALLGSGVTGGILTAAAAAAADGTFGNPDQPAEGAVNVTNPKALTDPGPQDPGLAGNEPAFLDPPATDVNGMPQFWASFNLAPKRIQNGGWARQITQDDFKISTTIAGVNMRLGPGGVRELHWHQQAEWAVMTYGNCRVTILDQNGRPEVADVKEGDLWYFPAGLPHSLQGLDPDGAEFVLAFDNGNSSEFNTLLVTDWIAHTPPEVLAKNFGRARRGVQEHSVAQQVDLPEQRPGAAAGRRSKRKLRPRPASHQIPSCSGSPICSPTARRRAARYGSPTAPTSCIRKRLPRRRVTVKPGGLRDMHWHPNADEWAYFIKGTARTTVFNTGPRRSPRTSIPAISATSEKALGHYVENTGNTDLVYMEVFRADRFEEVSLSDWLAHSPIDMVAETLNLDPSVIAQFPKNRPDIVPA